VTKDCIRARGMECLVPLRENHFALSVRNKGSDRDRMTQNRRATTRLAYTCSSLWRGLLGSRKAAKTATTCGGQV